MSIFYETTICEIYYTLSLNRALLNPRLAVQCYHTWFMPPLVGFV